VLRLVLLWSVRELMSKLLRLVLVLRLVLELQGCNQQEMFHGLWWQPPPHWHNYPTILQENSTIFLTCCATTLVSDMPCCCW